MGTKAATIYSIYISTAARGWNVFIYLKNISTTAFLAFLRQHSNSQMQSAISLSIFVNAVLHMLTEWLPLPTYNVCTLLASTRPPLNSCHMCKCCRNRPLLGLIPSSATGHNNGRLKLYFYLDIRYAQDFLLKNVVWKIHSYLNIFTTANWA